MIQRIAAAGMVTLLWLSQLSRADESSKAAKIEQLMQLTHTESMVTQMTGQIPTIMMSKVEVIGGAPESKATALELMNKLADRIAARMDWQKLKPDYIKLYGDVFAEEEIDGIVAFYQTPAGHAMIEKMPTLLTKSTEIAQRQMAGLMPEIQKTVEDLKQKSKNAPK
ncbi:MAG TPA: DUF2059 domain-containing protein [Bryobacteraceae bacterium]|jgi:hypothetical protein|nr:DUF2059 domain-containing protein [Bryobacteraceae bacterium]